MGQNKTALFLNRTVYTNYNDKFVSQDIRLYLKRYKSTIYFEMQ